MKNNFLMCSNTLYLIYINKTVTFVTFTLKTFVIFRIVRTFAMSKG